jgi:nucleoid DNA-binding protein
MAKLTKQALCEKIANETGTPLYEVTYIFKKMLDGIIDALARGEDIEFRNFGVFIVQTHKPKIGRNPRNPSQVVKIPARRVVKFKMGRVMKKRIMQEGLNNITPQGNADNIQ